MRSVLKILAVLALVLRGLVPVGVMLAPQAAGADGVSIVICTGHGPMTVALDADGNPVAPEPGATFDDQCAFAAANLHAGLPAESQGSTHPVELIQLPGAEYDAPEPGQGYNLTPPARGPPLFS